MDQGRHFLFIPGPTNVPERVLRTLSRSMEDHRGASFPEFSKPLLQDLKKLFKTEDGEVFIVPSSGTGAFRDHIFGERHCPSTFRYPTTADSRHVRVSLIQNVNWSSSLE